MIFWLIAGLLTVATACAVALPLLRRRHADGRSAEFDLEVYRDQIAELERDHARGLINSDELEAARTEIARRILAADARLKEASETGRTGFANAKMAQLLAAALAIIIPLGTIVLYLEVGEPGAPDMPLASRTDLAPDQQGDDTMRQLVAQLRARVAEEPGDGQAWQHLGMVLKNDEQYGEAVAAFRRARELLPVTPLLNSEFGEALTMAAGGVVTVEAQEVLRAALAQRPDDARARYYLALADYQAGRTQEALDGWAALIRDTPADAPWLDPVRERLTQAAQDLGRDVAAVMPEPRPAAPPAAQAPALTPEQREAMASMSPEEREAMIREMTDGLAARLEDDPMDLEGWQRLIRARTVLGDREEAQRVLERALEIFAEAPAPQQQLASLAGELGLDAPGIAEAHPRSGQGGSDMTAMVARLAARLEQEPDDLEGWVMLGRSYGVLGELDKARDAMARAMAMAPDNPEIVTLYARAVRDANGGIESDETTTLMRKVLELDPDHSEALWFVGQAEAKAGNRERARDLLEKLYGQIPEGNPDRPLLRQRIDELTGG